MRVLIREVSALYDAYRHGEVSPLPDLPIQYADYAVWQRQWLREEAFDQPLVYWRNQLKGVKALELPTDHPRPAAQSHQGASESLAINQELTQALKALSQREDVTMFMLLLGALQALLSKYSGQQEIVVGAPIAGRNRVEIENLIGFFLNTLVMKGDLRGNPTFREYLRRVREMSLRAFGYQDVPFEKLVEDLHPERDLSRSPLFQVWFNLLDFDDEELEGRLADLSLKPLSGHEPQAKFDLSLYVKPRGDGLQCSMVYNCDLFEGETVRGMLRRFKTLLEEIVENPGRCISDLPLIGEEELGAIAARAKLNAPDNRFMEFTREEIEQSIAERFEQQVKRYGHRTAVKTRREAWTYEELGERTKRITRELLARRGAAEERVVLLFDQGSSMIAGILGTLKAGKTYVPVDVSFPRERIVYLLNDTGAEVILTDSANLERAQELGEGRLEVINTEELVMCDQDEQIGLSFSPDRLAYILYTSGSTGEPKGVMQSHRNVLHFIRVYTNSLHISEEDRLSLLSSYGFDAAVMDIFGALLNGASVYPINLKEEEGRGVWDWVIKEGITIYHSTPTVYRHLLSEVDEEIELRGIRLVVLGGEEVTKRDVELYKKNFAASSIFINGLGPTESTMALQYKIRKETEINGYSAPVGYPVEGTEIELLNESGLGGYLYGEIAIKSEHVALGYWERPELTEQVFIEGDESEKRRIYRTGDLGRVLSDGSIEYRGRKDRQVKVRGYRIEPGEIEVALSEHTAVREAAVIAGGEEGGEKSLVAYVVWKNGFKADMFELRSYLKERLPEYMAPAAYVTLERLPLTVNGKLDQRALPRPEIVGRKMDEGYQGPLTEIGEMIAGIWRRVLRVEQVGAEDNFFELGGHSLLATRAISRIREVFKVELPLRAIFEERTLGGLSRRAEAELRAGAGLRLPAIERASRAEGLPLSFAQQRLWFIDQLEPGGAMYNIPSALRVRGELRRELLERVLSEVVRRHEALRTRFEVREGQPAQVIDEAAPIAVPVVDVSGLEELRREEEASRIVNEEAARSFDLSRGPLVRVGLVRLGEQEQIMLLTMHHIVSDGWSKGVLIREVSTLYEAYSKGEDSPLPELPVQYADYAVWQREWLQGETLERQISYWKERLEEDVALELPTDYPRPAAQSYRGERESLALGMELTDSVRELSRREGVTVFMLLLAAFKILLYRCCGQEQIVVGTPVAGRNEIELEPLIGFFVNMLAIKTDLGGGPSVREMIKREREAALGAYTHQDAPFEKVVEDLQPERKLNQHPIFQVTFEWRAMGNQVEGRSGLGVRPVAVESGTVQFDLSLRVTESGEGMIAVMEYRTDLFYGERIKRMLKHLRVALERMAGDVDRRVSELQMLSVEEEHQLLWEWNETACEYRSEKRIHQLFEEQVERRPETVAVVYKDQQVSYRELNARANQLAHHLRSGGVGPEVVVGVLLERSIEIVVGLLGILKAGGAYLPLDPHHPAPRIGQCLSLSGAAIVITTAQFELLAAEVVAGLTSENLPAVFFIDDLLKNHHRTENLGKHSLPAQLAYVIFTSGSTGAPKGAMVEQRGMLNHLYAKIRELPLQDEDVVAQNASQCFDISVWQFLAALQVGGQVQIFDDEISHDPASLLNQIEQRRVTILEVVPSLMRMMLTEADARRVQLDLSTVRWLIPTGEALPPELCRKWFGLYPEIPLLNAYGPTECSDDVTHCPIDNIPSESAVRSPIGRPIVNTQIHVLNAGLELQPMGIVGELYVGGIGVGRGYLNEPGKTAECFVPAPFGVEAGARVYRTGDLAHYQPDGNLEYLGRIDHQVKIRGFRIELSEIETVLRRHPSIEEAVVVAREDTPGEKRLAAYLVAKPERALAISELREILKRELPEYMAPTAYVMLHALPLTESGKLDRRALPAPAGANVEAEQRYVAPRTLIEQRLADIWSEVLGLDRVGVNNDFFELGGHSLLATRVVSRIRDAFQVELPLRRFFDTPTIADLALAIVQQQAEQVQSEDVMGLLAELEKLSEGEVRSILAGSA